MNTKIVLLDIAKRDLTAAKCLFREKLYPHAIFYLEQTVEKAIKAMGLHYKIITEDELEVVGHEAVKIYIKILQGLKDKVKRFQDKIKRFPRLKHTTLFEEFEKIGPDKFDEILTNFESFLRYSHQQLTDKKLGKALLELTKLEEEISSQKIKIKKDDINNVKSLVREVVNAMSEESPATHEIIIKRELEKIDSLTPQLMSNLVESLAIPLAICYNHLLFLSKALCPLAVSVRYPYPKNGHNPLKVYTEEHPLVKRFEQLSNIAEKALNRLEELFSENVAEIGKMSELSEV